MSFGSALYQLLIGPLELMFEVIFAIADRLVGNHGIAIIFLSLAINFLVLPLYRRADALQREQRDKAAQMKDGVDHIKKTFSGNERFLILQTFYRQHDYKQTDVFKGSISLLLQIPFFTAAYRFLSGLQLLKGMSFGPIADMGAPDGMLTLFGLTINVLPILMTAINYVSAAIYMKGFPFKSKLQTYLLALVFLVLLYNSPAGLVFYWTLNNLFSLLKNVFYKMKRPGLVLGGIFSAVSVFGLLYTLVLRPLPTLRMKLFVAVILLALQLPLILALRKAPAKAPLKLTKAEVKQQSRGFLLACLFLAVLTGVLIPSAVIHDSTSEFVNLITPRSPLNYVLSSALMAAGTFLIWFEIFYHLADARGRRVLGFAVTAMACCAAVNYLFFGTEFGMISSMLRYDLDPVFRLRDMAINAAVLLGLCALLYLVWKKKQALLRILIAALCFVTVGMSAVNLVGIQKDYRETVRLGNGSSEIPKIPLSRDGKNVVVIMLDRAMDWAFPYLVAEKPELEQMFSGFTYYPNTLSYGAFTNFGVPGIYGGYEYTPEEMNRRSDEPLVKKHNEALLLMPELFSDAGYRVTVFDPPYANYRMPTDLSLYRDLPGVRAYSTIHGTFNNENGAAENADKLRSRNFFCYSLFKSAPLLLQKTLYDNGSYNRADAAKTADVSVQTLDGISRATGTSKAFMDSYTVLEHLPDITRIDGSAKGTFLILANETTHNPMLLQEPDFVPAARVDNTAYDSAHALRADGSGNTVALTTEDQMIHYQSNMAALLKLGAWFNYLRANGLYDNTRIIIVSDHGRNTHLDPSMEVEVGGNRIDLMIHQPLLLVKDFDSEGLTTDEQFMTNADTPLLAMEGLIENPVNPFTGKALTNEAKYDGAQHVIFSSKWDVRENNGNTFEAGRWFAVDGDVRDRDSWTYLGLY